MAKRKRGHNGKKSEPIDPFAIDPEASKLTINSYEDVADSEDEFHLNRDKIALGDDRDAKRSKNNAYEPMELSDEEVLGYSDDDGSDDQEDEDEENDDVSQISDESKDENRDEADEFTGWGSSKADYYNADKIETEQDALDEEAEARRIQQKRLKALNEADFGFDENEWVQSGKNDEVSGHGGVVTEVLPQLQVTDEMSSATRLKLLKVRYPEFEPLAKEMMDLQPIHAELAEESRIQQNLEIGDNLRFSALTLKYNALSGYLGALAMYFAILTSTAANDEPRVLPLAPNELRDHDIMDSLVRCRDLWESVRNLAVLSPPQSPSSFGPGSPMTISSVDDSIKFEFESDFEAEGEATYRISTKSSKQQPSESAMSASAARHAARLRRTEESLAALTSSIHAQQRRSKHAIATAPATQQLSTTKRKQADSDLDSDLGDEQALTVAEAAQKAGRRKKSLKFYTSQLAQKANKRANAGRSGGGDDDVPRRERLRDRQERLNHEAEKRAQQERSGGTDLDLDAGESSDGDGLGETNREREARLESPGNDAEATLEEKMRAKKAAKAARQLGAVQSGNALRQQPLVQQIEEADGRREIGYKIEKNKGLAPKRKKEVRNPRVKKRLRYEDKKKKLRSMKATYKGGEARGGYGGELTGIKKGLVRSVKLS